MIEAANSNESVLTAKELYMSVKKKSDSKQI
jgi:hypothetical protein